MDQDNVNRVVETVVPLVSTYGLRILGAILILIAGRIAAGLLGRAVGKGMEKAKADPSLRGFIVALVKIGVIAFAVVAALSKFGVETTSFVAVLGAAGLAVGLALQGSLSNFAAGVMLLIFKPFRVGDLVKTAGHLGVVQDIGIFVTVMNTLDNQKIIVPNSMITGDVINNVNGNGIRRVDLTAGISYRDDMEKAKRICREVCEQHPHVLSDPAPQVEVSEMADSSVDLVVRPWCKGEHYWDVYFGVTTAIKAQFDAQGVTIPFPQRDVHLFQEASA